MRPSTATTRNWRRRSSGGGRTGGTRTTPSRRPTPPVRWPTPRSRPSEGEKLYVLDMFPYPSGAGLHVGHPLGYIGTDVFARYADDRPQRAARHGLRRIRVCPPSSTRWRPGSTRRSPPRTTSPTPTPAAAPGPGHDRRRCVATTDVDYYRWTQWIFLQMFGSWYDTAPTRPGRSPASPAMYASDDPTSPTTSRLPSWPQTT